MKELKQALWQAVRKETGMRIYFAGSIRGGRNDAAVYEALIAYLRSFGKVLTEHVGNPRLTFSHGAAEDP